MDQTLAHLDIDSRALNTEELCVALCVFSRLAHKHILLSNPHRNANTHNTHTYELDAFVVVIAHHIPIHIAQHTRTNILLTPNAAKPFKSFHTLLPQCTHTHFHTHAAVAQMTTTTTTFCRSSTTLNISACVPACTFAITI